MKINVSLTPVANLLAQINADNVGLNLTEAQVTIGVPSARTPDANLNNTTVTLTAIANQGYSGTKDITYMRLGLDKGVTSLPSNITILPSDTQDAIKSKIATALGLVLSDITFKVGGTAQDNTTNPFPIPANETSPVTVTVVAAANSLLYVGADLDVQLIVPDTDVPLGTAITTADMTGFEPA